VVQLFIDKLHYGYLGELSEGDNQNIREGDLEQFRWCATKTSGSLP
jgi:hypothetical protein